MFYLHHTPTWLRLLFPKKVRWQGDLTTGKEVYLTFDDGPHPVATPFVLQQLAKHGMKATFFCIGENVARHPEVYKQIIAEGHTVGNHTMNHIDGWRTNAADYLQNVQAASTLIDSLFFRPPYGRINQKQANAIHAQFPAMDIVMWGVIAGDFDEKMTGATCAHSVAKYTKPGSLIVYHDSEKAFERLQVALPLTLQMLAEKGWNSVAL